MNYIITFYSHFGAIHYKKLCVKKKIPARIMPVPRQLSSSCGTCVRCEDDYIFPQGECLEEVEQIVQVLEKGYQAIYRAEDS